MDDKNFMVESDTQPIDKPVIITAIEKEDVQTFLMIFQKEFHMILVKIH